MTYFLNVSLLLQMNVSWGVLHIFVQHCTKSLTSSWEGLSQKGEKRERERERERKRERERERVGVRESAREREREKEERADVRSSDRKEK